MKQPDFWKKKSLISFLLIPFAIIYYAGFLIRKILSVPYKSSIAVICVGNANAGGSGKTPAALAIADILMQKGKDVTFLSKGYKGTINYPSVVNLSEHSFKETGDEPLLLAKKARTVISKSRKAGIKYIEENIKTDVIIMDDGLQNPTIAKDLSFLVVDLDYGFGNGLLIPAGPLRETFSSAKNKSDVIILIGNDDTKIAQELSKGNKLVVKAKIKPCDTDNIPKTDAIAFAGIGNPDKFFTSLEQAGFNLVEKIPLPDHHEFTENEINTLFLKKDQKKCNLITTEKDIMRMEITVREKIFYLPVFLDWEDKSKIENFIKL